MGLGAILAPHLDGSWQNNSNKGRDIRQWVEEKRRPFCWQKQKCWVWLNQTQHGNEPANILTLLCTFNRSTCMIVFLRSHLQQCQNCGSSLTDQASESANTDQVGTSLRNLSVTLSFTWLVQRLLCHSDRSTWKSLNYYQPRGLFVTYLFFNYNKPMLSKQLPPRACNQCTFMTGLSS